MPILRPLTLSKQVGYDYLILMIRFGSVTAFMRARDGSFIVWAFVEVVPARQR